MRLSISLSSLTLLVLLSGCVTQSSLTKEEMATQYRADTAVANILFDQELNDAASYNVRKDGFVVVEFSGSVPTDKYTKAVGILRSSPDINGVRAEQAGKEVCPVTSFQKGYR